MGLQITMYGHFIVGLVCVCIILECIALALSDTESFYTACGRALRNVFIMDVVFYMAVLPLGALGAYFMMYGLAVHKYKRAARLCAIIAAVFLFCLKFGVSLVVMSFSAIAFDTSECVSAMAGATSATSFSAISLPAAGLIVSVISLAGFLYSICMTLYDLEYRAEMKQVIGEYSREMNEIIDSAAAYGWVW